MAVIKIEIDGGVLSVELDDADLEAAGEALGTSSPAETIKAAVADSVARSRAQAAYDDISKMLEDGDVDLGSLIEEDPDDGGHEHDSVDLAERIRNVRRAAQGKSNVLPEVGPCAPPRGFLGTSLIAREVERVISDLRQLPVSGDSPTLRSVRALTREVELRNSILHALSLQEPRGQGTVHARPAGRRPKGMIPRHHGSEAESSA
ncbi:hypothetical protein [Kitasatospora brasiliensis]|uniref:hypothetical protein n=1 Tax=Kitasatospora brasiliensis TaxID=3058040 RepID=UPI00292D0E99|nr:hypothetical protein [Kitasatospora sp. K002]